VRSYVDILEALHIVFLIRPYHRNIARAQAKAAKLYFYDWAYAQAAAGDATHFIEVKNRDEKPSFALRQMAEMHPDAQAIQLVRHARHAFDDGPVQVRPAADWLAKLAA
jgi:uncharacterized protein